MINLPKCFLPIFFVFAALPGLAQDVDYDQIIPPEGPDSLKIEERLVQLAWRNSPEASRVERQVAISGKRINLAKTAWMNQIVVTGNLNELSINQLRGKTDPNIPQTLFPRYNFGVNVPLGIFSQQANNLAIAREEKGAAEDEVNRLKLDIRAQVLNRYRVYLIRKESMEIQREILQEVTVRFKGVQLLFREGKAKFEEYDQATQAYNSERLRKVSVEGDLALAKIELERLIGLRLEQVIR